MVRNGPRREEFQQKVFTEREISIGITKLERRINEVIGLDPREIAHDDGIRETVQNNIRDTIRDIFGVNSQEALDFAHPSLYHSDNIVRDWDDDNPEYDYQAYGRGLPQMETRLRGLITRLEEKRLDLVESPEVQSFQLFQGMRLHSRIAAVSSDLFRDGHYPQAVFDASKALINFVKEKSGRYDLDGVALMTEVFSVNKPILRFNDLADQSDKDEQQGMMHLFMGATLGVRNPRGHSFLTDSPEEALEFIGLMSLLANRLEKARK
jgi:uncharacterized protein (TIGR02391 family)